MASFPQQFGPYQLEDLIARGGMAEVYRATVQGASTFSRTVAIKKILPHLAENEGFITMLIHEARLVVGLNHANIAQVYDLGKIDQTYYVAMEYVHGVDVSTMIKTLQARDQIVPFEHITYILSCICMGLHVAHHACTDHGQPMNIVHRDVSPHNVLVSFSGDVKVIDFGVAKADRLGGDATEVGILKGKLLYMAPEQAMNKGLDGRADLFAAGLVMYKMLTLSLPFEGENEFQVYSNILNKEIQPPKLINPHIPEELNQICMTLLQRDPDRRYQDGLSAKQALDRALHRIAPGYTPARLGRFVEDNFSAQFLQKQADALAAQTSPPYSPAPGDQQAYVQLHDPPTAPSGYVRHKEESGNNLPAAAETPANGWPSHTNQFASEHLASIPVTAQVEVPHAAPPKGGSPPLVLFAVVFMALLFGGLILAMVLMPEEAALAPKAPETKRARSSSLASEDKPAALIDLSFDSSPSGATVFLGSVEVGKTPYAQTSVNPADFPLTFVVKKAGYEVHEVTLTQGAPALLAPVTLLPLTPEPQEGRSKVKKAGSPEGEALPAAPKRKAPSSQQPSEPRPPVAEKPTPAPKPPDAPPATEEVKVQEEEPKKDVKFIDLFADPAPPPPTEGADSKKAQVPEASESKKGKKAPKPASPEDDGDGLEWNL